MVFSLSRELSRLSPGIPNRFVEVDAFVTWGSNGTGSKASLKVGITQSALESLLGGRELIVRFSINLNGDFVYQNPVGGMNGDV